MAHGGRARGEMGGGTREQCGSNKSVLVHFFTPFKTYNWSDLAGDEGGGDGGRRGEVAHGGRAGGAPESSVGATKSALGPPFGSLTAGLMVGREQCESNKRCTGSPFWAPSKT